LRGSKKISLFYLKGEEPAERPVAANEERLFFLRTSEFHHRIPRISFPTTRSGRKGGYQVYAEVSHPIESLSLVIKVFKTSSSIRLSPKARGGQWDLEKRLDFEADRRLAGRHLV